MAGFDLRKGSHVSRVEGASSITIDDFSQPMVDVSFTNIKNTSSGDRLPDIVWDDVHLSGGTFTEPGLTGQFYGPNHEEVGGVFFRDNISGAFGASR